MNFIIEMMSYPSTRFWMYCALLGLIISSIYSFLFIKGVMKSNKGNTIWKITLCIIMVVGCMTLSISLIEIAIGNPKSLLLIEKTEEIRK